MAETDIYIDQIDELILKYLSGNSSGTEEKEILAWIAQNPENKKHFQQMSDVWNISLLPSSKKKIDTKKAYLQFLKNQNKQNTRKLPVWVYSVAAAILLLISFVGLQNIKSDRKYLITDNTIITDTLADGSEVSLNKHSSVTFYAKKLKRKRYAVMEGEVYFNIKHDATKPFYVIAAGSIISVTGTSFNVKCDREELVISLIEGSITVNLNDTAKVLKLKAGEKFTFNKLTGTAESNQSLDPNDLTWKTKELVFRNSHLNDVLTRLEEIYGIKFQYDKSIINELKFDGRLYTDDFQTIINTLEVTFNLKIIPESKENFVVNLNN